MALTSQRQELFLVCLETSMLDSTTGGGLEATSRAIQPSTTVAKHGTGVRIESRVLSFCNNRKQPSYVVFLPNIEADDSKEGGTNSKLSLPPRT